ncbi:MAG: hypothetical protein GY940_08230 [bacterium]|nr:hypothetical protein [bacterium]
MMKKKAGIISLLPLIFRVMGVVVYCCCLLPVFSPGAAAVNVNINVTVNSPPGQTPGQTPMTVLKVMDTPQYKNISHQSQVISSLLPGRPGVVREITLTGRPGFEG